MTEIQVLARSEAHYEWVQSLLNQANTKIFYELSLWQVPVLHHSQRVSQNMNSNIFSQWMRYKVSDDSDDVTARHSTRILFARSGDESETEWWTSSSSSLELAAGCLVSGVWAPIFCTNSVNRAQSWLGLNYKALLYLRNYNQISICILFIYKIFHLIDI